MKSWDIAWYFTPIFTLPLPKKEEEKRKADLFSSYSNFSAFEDCLKINFIWDPKIDPASLEPLQTLPSGPQYKLFFLMHSEYLAQYNLNHFEVLTALCKFFTY